MDARISSFWKGGRKGRIRLLVVVGFAASACIISTATPTATLTPTVAIATQNVEQTVEAALTATAETEILPTEKPIPTLSANLTQAGPWLVLNTNNGIVAFNPDGSGLTRMSAGSVKAPDEFQSALSPRGGYLAYITSTDSRFLSGLTLNITALPAAKPFKTIALTSPQNEAGPDSQPGDPQIDILRAITEIPSLAWSHDGTRLAFIGAMDGPSADLYVYDPGADTVTRLTDGPTQGYRPIWSPDDAYIIQAAADTFGTGAGYHVTGIYAARADNTKVVSLYDIPANSGDEIGVGWLDAETLAVETWSAGCGACNLRLVSLPKQKVTVLHEGYIYALASNPAGGSMVYSLPLEQDTPDLGGLYIVTAVNPIPTIINGADINFIEWSAGIGGYFAREANGTIYEISSTGNSRVSAAKTSEIPLVSPNGSFWAFTGDGIILVGDRPAEGSTGFQTATISISIAKNNGIMQWIWSPDSQSLYVWGVDNSIYRIHAPDWTYQAIATDVYPGGYGLSMGWGEAG